MEEQRKLLVTLDDLIVRGTLEMRQEIYIVGLGYRVWNGGVVRADSMQLDQESDDVMDLLTANAVKDLKNWYFAFATPIFKIRKRRKHVFPGGLPLFMGKPGDDLSFYMAIMESKEGHRDAGKSIAGAVDSLKLGGLLDEVLNVAAVSNPTTALVKTGFSALVKAFELALLNRKDEIKYTNVFSFRRSNGYLEGTYSDWGNRRAEFTMTSELE